MQAWANWGANDSSAGRAGPGIRSRGKGWDVWGGGTVCARQIRGANEAHDRAGRCSSSQRQAAGGGFRRVGSGVRKGGTCLGTSLSIEALWVGWEVGLGGGLHDAGWLGSAQRSGAQAEVHPAALHRAVLCHAVPGQQAIIRCTPAPSSSPGCRSAAA